MEMEAHEMLYCPVKNCLRQIRCTEKFFGNNPEIVVEGLGPLNPPLTESEANQLAKIGCLVPVEDYDDDIEQEKLCRTWHLDLSEFNFKSSHWHEALSEIVNNKIKLELGLKKDEKVSLKLCKLLLHERGDRPFAPFNDANSPISVINANNNEEDEFVFATLSVFLHSVHSGGDIVVAFNGHRPAFDAVNTPSFDCNNFYETFFSECHRMTIQSLASEANLALAYNLVCSSENCQPPITESSVIISRVRHFLESWQMNAGKHKCDMLSVVFEHKYKATGLSWQDVKGQDRAVVLAIAAAAREAKFDLYLSTFNCYERIGSYRCGWYDLDLCDGEKAYTFSDFIKVSTEEEFESINISNGHRYMVRGPQIKSYKTGFSCKNLLQHPANMKDRWCRQMALVLWSSENLDNILLKEELNLAVDFSLDWAKQLARHQFGHFEEQCCNVFTASILRHGMMACNLPIGYISLDAQGNFDSNAGICIIDAFKKTSNRHLFQLFVENVLKSRASALSVDLLKELIDCSVCFGLDLVRPIINTIVEDEKAFHTAVTLLRELSTSITTGISHYSSVIDYVAPKLLDQLNVPVSCNHQKQKFNIAPLTGHDNKVIANATSLLCIYSSLGNAEWLVRVIQYIRQNPDRYPVNTVTVHAVHHWNSWLEAEQAKDHVAATALDYAVEQKMKLVEDCIKHLKQSAVPPTKPQDWTRDMKPSCQCRDCSNIKCFMQHPKQCVLHMSLGKVKHFERKRHVMEICKGILDLSTTVNSPEVITISKTNASYEVQRKSYHQSMLAIENLRKLLPAGHPLHLKETGINAKQQHNGKTPQAKKPKMNNGQCVLRYMPLRIS